MLDWRAIVLVAAGGAIGAVLRALVSTAVAHRLGSAFPYGTLLINLTGSFLIGLLAELALRGLYGVTPEVRSFAVVGVLGGFTTFSAFSYEMVALSNGGAVALAALYAGASVVGGFLAAAGGLALARSLS